MRLQQGKYVTHFQMNFKIRNNKYPPKIKIGSKLTGVTVSTLLSSRFSNHFYPSTTSWSERLRACAMNWAWKQWNSLSKSSITNSKHKPQARQKIFFFFFLNIKQKKTKQKYRNLYTAPPNLNQTLSSMLKMILSNTCLEWKESKIWICIMRTK